MRESEKKMYQCFHCGSKSVIWDADFDSEDYGYEQPGIIHECHCTECGAQITYFCPNEWPEKDDEETETEQN